MRPLRGFVSHLATCKYERAIALSIEKINIAINPKEFVPTIVMNAVKQLQENAKDQIHVDAGLAAVFLGVTQGKTILKLALEYAEASGEEMQTITAIQNSIGDLERFKKKCEDGSPLEDSEFQKCMTASIKLLKAVGQRELGQATKNYLQEAKDTVQEMALFYCTDFVRTNAVPWFSTFSRGHVLPDVPAPVPPMYVKELSQMASDKAMFIDTARDFLSATSSLQTHILELDSICRKKANGSLDTVSALRKAEEFNTFITQTGVPLLQKVPMLQEPLHKTKQIVIALGGEKVNEEASKSAISLGRLVSKASSEVVIKKNCCLVSL